MWRSADGENGPDHWITHHFVCFYFLFLRFENRGEMILSSVSMLIHPSASTVLLQTRLSNMCVNSDARGYK